jgi:negative regulator of PHO system
MGINETKTNENITNDKINENIINHESENNENTTEIKVENNRNKTEIKIDNIIDNNSIYCNKSNSKFVTFNISRINYGFYDELENSQRHLVTKCQHKDFQDFYVCKVFKFNEEMLDGSCFREIGILKTLDHPNIIKISSVDVSTRNVKYFMKYYPIVLYKLITKELNNDLIKYIFYQILLGLEYLQSKQIIHTDIRPENIFLNSNFSLVIGDFDSVLFYDGKPLDPSYNQVIYYRSPEVHLGMENFDYKIDIWSLGCTIIELIIGKPLFKFLTKNKNLSAIFQLLGVPKDWEEAKDKLTDFSELTEPTTLKNLFSNSKKIINPNLLDLLEQMLVINPNKRISASEALKHIYFSDIAKINSLTDYKSVINDTNIIYSVNQKLTNILYNWLDNLIKSDLSKDKYYRIDETYKKLFSKFIDLNEKSSKKIVINTSNLQLIGLLIYIIVYHLNNKFNYDVKSISYLCDNKLYTTQAVKYVMVHILYILDFDILIK